MRYVAPSPGSHRQDYLAADLSPSYPKDVDRTAAVSLRNLPWPNRPKPTIAQNRGALSKAKPQITLAATHQSDLDLISQQEVCPVMGSELNSMGAPIKTLVDGKPLYLCCSACVPKLKDAPETYLAKARRARQEE